MTSQRVPWSSSDDYVFFSLIALVAGCGLLGAMVWNLWHAEITAFYLRAMLWQIGHLHTSNPSLLQLRAQMQAAQYRPDLVRILQLYYGLAILGAAIKWPIAIGIAGLGAACMLRAAPGRFTKALDLDGLIALQAEMFPTLKGFARRRLDTLVAPQAGAPWPADPALTCAEWRACYAHDAQGNYSAVGARSALTAQLGRHWTSLEQASPIEQILFAAFALHHAQERQAAIRVLGDLSTALEGAGLDGANGPKQSLVVPREVLVRALAELDRAAARSTIDAVCAPHGWTVTALMSLLTEARRRAGVLAPPAFAITKLIDRPLWYALHSLGFPSENPAEDVHPNPRIEAAGARAHWAEERRIGRPIYTPALTAALATVEPIEPTGASS